MTRNWGILSAMVKADFLERTRRTSFLVTICLIIYLGYAVNTGQIFIKLDTYRGIYNAAWVGGLMSLVITFFLGLAGFFLVKNAVDRDERTGVGQIIATTPLTRPQYLLGKWLSNFAVLAALIAILALAAIVMQLINREAALEIWPLIAPFLFVVLPMMALVAALAVFFETVPWLKGGFGNMVYFGVFMALFIAAVYLTDWPWLDVTGLSVLGPSMKAALKAVYPEYSGSFTLSMADDAPLQTYVWPGLDWTVGLIAQRLGWLVVSLLVALCGSLFFRRFDSYRAAPRRIAIVDHLFGRKQAQAEELPEEKLAYVEEKTITLTPLAGSPTFRVNLWRLAWLECLLLLKGVRWYWWAGMALLWLMCVTASSGSERQLFFAVSSLWPVLIWSAIGQREARYQAEALIFQATHADLRLLAAGWLAGVLVTALMCSGVLVGRLLAGEPLALLSWLLSVLFIPTLALALGVWSRSSKLFEVIYPILWYLGPFNRENGLMVIDYLGIHPPAPVNTQPLLFSAVIVLLLVAAYIGRKRHLRI